MSMQRLPKIFLIASGVLACSLVGGVGLAGFAQGDAFYFYKYNAPSDPIAWQPSMPVRDSGYPIDATVQPAAYSAQPAVQSQYLAQSYEPAYDDRDLYRSYGYEALASEPVPAEAVEPVVQVSRGSWTQPVAFDAGAAADEIKPKPAEVAAAGDTSVRPAPAPVETEATAAAQP